jgi:hypothetical protein
LQDLPVYTNSYTVTGLASNTTYYYRVRASTEYDTDAQAFFTRVTTAGGSLTTTEQQATNTLVLSLKGYSIWSKMKAIYPMVGASAAACAQNLKSSSFTGSFTSGWTFASTGVTPNGTSAYMDTDFNIASNSQRNSTHISVYLRTNSDSLMCDMGGAVAGSEIDIFAKLSNIFYPRCNSSANAGVANNVSSLGLFISNRITSTEIRAWRNNNLSILSDTSQSPANSRIFIGALRNDSSNTTSLYSNRQNAFSSIGDGLSDTEASNFYTAVQAFQTTLARQV